MHIRSVQSFASYGVGQGAKSTLSKPIPIEEYDKHALKRKNNFKIVIPRPPTKQPVSTFGKIEYGAKATLTKLNYNYDANSLQRPSQIKTPIPIPWTKEYAAAQFAKPTSEEKKPEQPPPSRIQLLKQLIKSTRNPDLQDRLIGYYNFLLRIENISKKRLLTVVEQKRLEKVLREVDAELERLDPEDVENVEEEGMPRRGPPNGGLDGGPNDEPFDPDDDPNDPNNPTGRAVKEAEDLAVKEYMKDAKQYATKEQILMVKQNARDMVLRNIYGLRKRDEEPFGGYDIPEEEYKLKPEDEVNFEEEAPEVPEGKYDDPEEKYAQPERIKPMDPALEELINRQFNQFNQAVGPKQVDPVGPIYAQIPKQPMYEEPEAKVQPEMLRGMPIIEQPPEEPEELEEPEEPEEPEEEEKTKIKSTPKQEDAYYQMMKENGVYAKFDGLKPQEKVEYLAGNYKVSNELKDDIDDIFTRGDYVIGDSIVSFDLILEELNKQKGMYKPIIRINKPEDVANILLTAFNTIPDLKKYKDRILLDIVNNLPKKKEEIILPRQRLVDDWIKNTDVTKALMTSYLKNIYGIKLKQRKGQTLKETYKKLINDIPAIQYEALDGRLTKAFIKKELERKEETKKRRQQMAK